MARIHSRDTKPEMFVRRLVFRMGYRYRLHQQDLPGKPDMVFSSRKKVIFVHGCFWHGHSCPLGDRPPKSRTEFWTTKIGTNRERDKKQLNTLMKMGWDALVVWECQLKDSPEVERIIRLFLG